MTSSLNALSSGVAGAVGATSQNLISNGDFSNGDSNWQIQGDGQFMPTGGELCIAGATSTTIISWSATALDGPASYRLRYSATGVGNTMHVKVVLAAPPNASVYDPPIDDALIPQGQTFTHDFNTQQAYPDVGLAFSFPFGTSSMVCMFDVSLTTL